MSAFAQAERTEHISQEISEPPPQTGYDGELLTMPLSWIVTSPLNPRKTFDEGYIAELAISLKELGQLQPIVVRRRMKANCSIPTYEYEIIMGECRFRAAKIASFATIKAIVRNNVSDREHLEMALVENLQRRDINPIEEASGYKQLADMGLSQKEICAKVNRSQGAVSNAMRLLKLPESVLDHISQGHLSPAHALSIVKYADWPPVAEAIVAYVLKNKTSAQDLTNGQLWNLWYQLEQKELFVAIHHRNPWEKQCKVCPLNAYKGDQSDHSGSGRCFRPDHWAELEAESAAAAAAKIAKETAALRERAATDQRLAGKLATASPAGVSVRTDHEALRLDDLGHNKYDRIDYCEVEGCTEACPCRTVALDSRNQPCRICIDPGRRNAMKGQATKILRARIKEEGEKRIFHWREETCDGTLASDFLAAKRAMAIAAWTVLSSTPVEHRRAVAKPLVDSKLKALLCQNGYQVKDEDAWNILFEQDMTLLFSVLGEVRLRQEIAECIDNRRTTVPVANYLLAPAAPRTPVPPPELPRDIDCPECKGLARLKRPEGKSPRYECGCGYYLEA